MDKLSEVLARNEIQDSLSRYARGVDRRDWPAVRACYHDDATDAHGEFSGSADDFIDWVSKRHSGLPFSMHFLGNCLIDFLNDDTAAVETYFIAIQRRETRDENGKTTSADAEVFGRYCDRFEKRDGVWRVATRKVVYDSTRTLPSTNHLRKPAGIAGRRDSSDTVFTLFSQAPHKVK